MLVYALACWPLAVLECCLQFSMMIVHLLERVEDSAVEQFVTDLRVEALAIAVFHGLPGMM